MTAKAAASITGITGLTAALAAKVDDTDLSSGGKGTVVHGAVAGTARPSGFLSIEWIGSVEPSNAIDGDTWIDTT